MKLQLITASILGLFVFIVVLTSNNEGIAQRLRGFKSSVVVNSRNLKGYYDDDNECEVDCDDDLDDFIVDDAYYGDDECDDDCDDDYGDDADDGY